MNEIQPGPANAKLYTPLRLRVISCKRRDRVHVVVVVVIPSTPYDPPDHHLRGGGSANAASRPAFTPARLQYTNVCSTLTTPLPFDNHIATLTPMSSSYVLLATLTR